MAQSYAATNAAFPAVWSFKQDDDKQRVGTSEQRKHDNGDNVRDSSHITTRKQRNKLKAWALTNPLPDMMFLLPFKWISVEAGESDTESDRSDSLGEERHIDMHKNTELLRHAACGSCLAVAMICLRFARFLVA